MQQSEYINSPSPEVKEASDSASLTEVPPITTKLEVQGRQIGRNISVFLAQLPDYLSRFFQQYKQQIITVALILAALIAMRVFLAILDALNNIPLLTPTFELIGIGYTAWFVNRYLLSTSKRQKLAQEVQTLKQQIVGS